MGIFDFLKKIIEDKKSENIKKERIVFSEIRNWVENKKKEIEIKEKNFFVLIKDKINHFTNNLEVKINVVKGVDINQRKVEDKLKSATEEGRSKYLESLESFIRNLNNLPEDKAERFILEVDKFFSDFNKTSHMSYERATILIGKEMGDIKNEIKSFSKDLIWVFDEHKDIIDFSKAISLIEIKLKQIEEIKKDEARAYEKIISLDKEIAGKEEENKRIFEEIEQIKKSPEYSEHLNILEECKSLKEDLEKDLFELRQLIDFKSLGNFFHIFEEEMERVKSYRDKFKINFQKDDGKEILKLLNIAKLNTSEILNKINEINSKKEILKNKAEGDKDKTQKLSSQIQKMSLEIDNLKNLKIREEKRLKKFKTGEEEIVSEIRKDFEKIGVDLY